MLLETNTQTPSPGSTTLPKQVSCSRIRLSIGNEDDYNTDQDNDHDETSDHTRLVAIRYYLDRPGYDLHNCAGRLWFDPPRHCRPADLCRFLTQQNIALPGLLVEIYVERMGAFMMLEACQAAGMVWDFAATTRRDPGILNLRLTDLDDDDDDDAHAQQQAAAAAVKEAATPKSPSSSGLTLANVTPSGLFSFAMMVALETAHLTGQLIPNSVHIEQYLLKWGPYMFFVGGLLQIVVAIFQVFRNNVYGATAFLGFGSFWFANGLASILETYFGDEATGAAGLVGNASGTDHWGNFVRLLFILMFCCALLVQTFAMNKLSSTLIALLCTKVLFSALAGWSKAAQWGQFVTGWLTAFMAYYVFLVELTNSIYHKEIFKVHRWHEAESPQEVFGAAGRTGTLHSKATRLRQAKYPQVSSLRAARCGVTSTCIGNGTDGDSSSVVKA